MKIRRRDWQVNERIQARKVKARLCVLKHAQPVSGDVSQTCRFFEVSEALFFICKKRCMGPEEI